MKIIFKYFPTYFVYHPPGYPLSEIGEIIDTSQYADTHRAATMCHISQKDDLKKIIPLYEELPQKEFFLIRKK